MSGFIGVVIGVILGFVASIGIRLWEEWRFRKGLRAALRAEITSILEIAERRRYEDHFETHVSFWEEEKALNEWPTIIGYQETQHHPVLEANMSHIGKLGSDVAADVVRFYSTVTAVQTDITAATRHQLDHLGRDQRISLVKQNLAFWREAKALGRTLIGRL